MKKILALLCCLGLFACMVGQVPVKMTYQAVIRNNQGSLVKNQMVHTRIQLIQGNQNGIAVYTESHLQATNENGLLTLVIGDGDVIYGALEPVDWEAGPYFLKTETDPSGGNNFSITDVSQLLSVPYALYAASSGDGFNGNFQDLSDKPDFSKWDTNVADDFSGSYSDLTNIPDFAPVQDDEVTTNAVWSSAKTAQELALKANASEVYTKISLQTAGQAGVHYGNLIHKPENLDEDKSDDVTLTGNQTISGNKTFTDKLTANGGIHAGNQRIAHVATPQDAGDAVNKAYADQMLSRIEVLESALDVGSFTDSRDSHTYKWVKIGNQVWMAQNLAYLPTVSPVQTESRISPVYYVYDYYGTDPAEAKNSNTYKYTGVLYNWPAAMAGSESSDTDPSGVQGVCPSGWHLPGNAEWAQLVDFLGGAEVAGGALKHLGTSYWAAPNIEASDASDFGAVGAGIREGSGMFKYLQVYCLMWSASQFDSNNAYRVQLRNNSGTLYQYYDPKEYGYSVRCVKDQ